MQLVTIDSIIIKQDTEGRYCLNDLHKAAGEDQKNRPKYWMENAQTQALVGELQKGGFPPVSIRMGRNGGTIVVKELVYAYAMWISPQFHLKVIRAYDTLVTKGVAVHEDAAADLLSNPLKYLEAIMGQAKALQLQVMRLLGRYVQTAWTGQRLA